MKTHILLATFLTVMIPTALHAMELPFPTTTDFPSAVAQAKSEKKTIFLAFLSSGCSHCQALKKSVLDTPAFASFAKANLVSVVFDYEELDALTEAQQSKLSELETTFEMQGFPTIVLLNPDGTVLLKSAGYGGSSAEEVIALFKERIRARSTQR